MSKVPMNEMLGRIIPKSQIRDDGTVSSNSLKVKVKFEKNEAFLTTTSLN